MIVLLEILLTALIFVLFMAVVLDIKHPLLEGRKGALKIAYAFICGSVIAYSATDLSDFGVIVLSIFFIAGAFVAYAFISVSEVVINSFMRKMKK
jgi:hypothetical protein